MKRITSANGRPVVIAAVCSATRPPPTKSAAATAPSRTAQKSLWSFGGSGFPPAVMMSMTIEPESEEVTKKVIITSTVIAEVAKLKGKCSRSLNRATGMFSCTALAMPPAPSISTFSALLPKMASQKKVMRVGTKSTPRMNSRTVRP